VSPLTAPRSGGRAITRDGLYGFYILRRAECHRIYMARGTNLRAAQHALTHAGGVVAYSGALAMLDVVFLVIGAVFLGGCVLYALACDHL